MHSDKVPYFILDLLQQVPSVYVQGLGRFDAIFHPAVVDLQQSQIKPPHLEPGFSAGDHDERDILPTYIYYVTGIDQEKALEHIRQFVSTVHHHVNSTGSYSIEKFGTFSKSAADILHFTPDWDAFNLSFTGLATLDLHPVSTVLPEKKEPIPQPVVVVPKEIVPVVDDTPSDTNWVTDQEVQSPEREEETVVATGKISDSTSRLWWVILATALFLITILCAYLAWDIFSNRDQVNQIIAITNDTLANSNPDIIIVDTIAVIREELPADTPSTPEPEPIVEVPEPIEDPCFIVVGAFTQSDNVARMEQRLASMGYVSELIKGGSLTRVAIRTSCDETTVQKTLNDARSNINPEAWIY